MTDVLKAENICILSHKTNKKTLNQQPSIDNMKQHANNSTLRCRFPDKQHVDFLNPQAPTSLPQQSGSNNSDSQPQSHNPTQTLQSPQPLQASSTNNDAMQDDEIENNETQTNNNPLIISNISIVDSMLQHVPLRFRERAYIQMRHISHIQPKVPNICDVYENMQIKWTNGYEMCLYRKNQAITIGGIVLEKSKPLILQLQKLGLFVQFGGFCLCSGMILLFTSFSFQFQVSDKISFLFLFLFLFSFVFLLSCIVCLVMVIGVSVLA